MRFLTSSSPRHPTSASLIPRLPRLTSSDADGFGVNMGDDFGFGGGGASWIYLPMMRKHSWNGFLALFRCNTCRVYEAESLWAAGQHTFLPTAVPKQLFGSDFSVFIIWLTWSIRVFSVKYARENMGSIGSWFVWWWNLYDLFKLFILDFVLVWVDDLVSVQTLVFCLIFESFLVIHWRNWRISNNITMLY